MWLTVRAPLRVRPRAGADLSAAASAVAVLADLLRPGDDGLRHLGRDGGSGSLRGWGAEGTGLDHVLDRPAASAGDRFRAVRCPAIPLRLPRSHLGLMTGLRRRDEAAVTPVGWADVGP